MKAAVATIVVVFAIGWISSSIDLRPDPNAVVQVDYGKDSWRRTKDGWEDAKGWHNFQPPPCDVSVIHPTAVAAITLFACIAVLVGFGASTGKELEDSADDLGHVRRQRRPVRKLSSDIVA